MKNLILILAILLFYNYVFSQARGVKLANGDNTLTYSNNIKMVVVGVSKYQNIQSLNYGHTDAQTFYNYMVSNEGGKVDPANAKVLLNEKATSANIFAALNWLVDGVQEGETVIFYFAGHGDLENKTMFQNGFLLANDAPTAAYMAGGTVSVIYLQQYLTTLVQKNKARVILITDACHSGKLAGGLEGAANTATALQGNWENTTKILSSQPGELSQEGTQWNGGGGVFTYYLVKGMMGFADRNHDKKITVNEMNIYLNDNVPKETNFTQNPSVSGNSSTVLAFVDSINFSKIIDNESFVKMDKSLIAQRGNDEGLKKMLDTASFRSYQQFMDCIEKGYLIKATKKHNCAWDIYQKMKDDKKAATFINTMRIALVASLQNRSQIFVSAWIGNTPWPPGFNSQIIFAELEKAYQLTDTTSINYRIIKSKYLLGKAFNTFVSESDKIKLVDSSLALEPDNAFTLYCKAEIYKNSFEYEKAIPFYNHAIDLAPRMFLSYKSLVKCYRKLNKFDEAIATCKTGIDQVPLSSSFYLDLYSIYDKDVTNEEKCLFYLNKYDSVAILLKKPQAFCAIGEIYKDKYKDTLKALSYFEKAIEIDSIFPNTYYIYSSFYKQKGDTLNQTKYYSKGLQAELAQIKKDIMIDSENEYFYYRAVRLFAKNNKTVEALKYFELALQNGLNNNEMIQQDTDIDNIRNTKEFKELIKKYLK